MNELMKMPKILLHIHLDGSLRPKTVQKWLKESQKKVPQNELKKQLMADKSCKNLEEYLEKFTIPCELLQTKERLHQATFELLEDCSKENIRYVEIRFAPQKHTNQGLSQKEVIAAVLKGKQQAEEKYFIKSNIILCLMRGAAEEKNNETLSLASIYLNKGVCGIDLAGAESLYPTKDYEKYFKKAQAKKIPFTIHAGESEGIESIRAALKMKPNRLGHGIHCIEDRTMVKKIKKKKIVLEICPLSNLQTHAIKGKYPLEELYKKGVKITINTDNNTVTNTNLTKEYQWVLKNTHLTIKDLKKMNHYALSGSFLNNQEKRQLKKYLK